MRIAVTGASGLLGRAVVAALLDRGDEVVALGRSAESMGFPDAVTCRGFDPNDASAQPEVFADADAVIHLAGESIAGRWTERKKRAIWNSRVDGTANLVRSLAACARPPKALLSASGAGFYGSRGDTALFESDRPGGDFLARLCVEWEAAASAAEEHGIRTAMLRTGIVVGKNADALTTMAAPFAFGIGGPLGSGTQFVPWIHLDDLVRLYLFVLDRDMRGAINAVAPDYATSARFSQAMGSALRRPSLAPAPAFALHALLGEFAGSILASQLIIPARAEDGGFMWRHPLIEEALADALHSNIAPPYGVQNFESAQTVRASSNDVFAFFSDPRNLEYLTPPSLRFAFAACPESVERGSTISYRLRLHGVPLRWKTLIAQWQAPHRFVDVQLHGPYTLWRHEHVFEPEGENMRLIDRVQYVLPFAPFGNLARPLVQHDIEQIFAFRKKRIEEHFA